MVSTLQILRDQLVERVEAATEENSTTIEGAISQLRERDRQLSGFVLVTNELKKATDPAVLVKLQGHLKERFGVLRERNEARITKPQLDEVTVEFADFEVLMDNLRRSATLSITKSKTM